MRMPFAGRQILFAAILTMLLITWAYGYTLDMPGLQKHVSAYNSNIDKAPGLLKSVLGSERVNLVITRYNGSIFRAGMNMQSGRIVHVISGGYNNSTIVVTTNQSSIDEVVNARDKITAFTNSTAQGRIDIQTNSWTSDIKIKSLLSSGSVLQFGFNLFFG